VSWRQQVDVEVRHDPLRIIKKLICLGIHHCLCAGRKPSNARGVLCLHHDGPEQGPGCWNRGMWGCGVRGGCVLCPFFAEAGGHCLGRGQVRPLVTAGAGVCVCPCFSPCLPVADVAS